MKNACAGLAVLVALSPIIGCSPRSSAGFTVPADYKTWKRPVAGILDYPVPGHGRKLRQIYANDRAFAPAVSRTDEGKTRYQYADGSIIIKETYENQEELKLGRASLTIMVKASGHPDALKGWRYFSVKPGEQPKPVTTGLCIGCHEAANEAHPYFDRNRTNEFRDFLFIPPAK